MAERRTDFTDEQIERMIWVRTDPSANGKTYVVTVEFDDDNAKVITPANAFPYTKVVLAVAQRAEYDSAVYKQLKERDLPLQEIGSLIVDLRRDRPPINQKPIAPLRLEPGVNAEGKAFVGIFLNDKQHGQWEVDDARAHALHVLEAVEAADLDAGYFRALTGAVGLDEPIARQVVGAIAGYRDEVSP